MLTLTVGIIVGWAVTGVADFYAAKRVHRRAYEQGCSDTLKQVSGW